jgi:hypothetical protein
LGGAGDAYAAEMSRCHKMWWGGCGCLGIRLRGSVGGLERISATSVLFIDTLFEYCFYALVL